MNNPWDPFRRPRPTINCLMHEAILVQAWKKSHDYIRTRNWYADVLELDLSAANLRDVITDYRISYNDQGHSALKPAPLRLVPAPKSHHWEFQNCQWIPNTQEPHPVLRPLAHLAIRDQTFATAILICLADIVESVQGDCSVATPQEARDKGVSSYGNRLFCEWPNSAQTSLADRARFCWGNACSYRKYYTDYRAFLRRPRDLCSEAEAATLPNEEAGIVFLDLESFYDRIDLRELLTKLKRLCIDHSITSDPEFWKCVKSAFGWKWENIPNDLSHLLRDNALPKGLPQGMVASGFFSNSYMLEFDKAIRDSLDTSAETLPFTIVDYCRYVDDIRLVVRWDRTYVNEADLLSRCQSWIDSFLTNHAPGQCCNCTKTKYVPYRELQSRSGRAATMDFIQQQLSGPTDIETIEKTSVAIEGLLSSLEQSSASDTQSNGKSGLENVFQKSHEIRDDTMTRFASYRQSRLLRERRRLLYADESKEAAIELAHIDAEIELAARRMIWLWSHDPSLAIVLRHGMNLLPSPELLNPVLEALRSWITSSKATDTSDYPVYVCWYVAADLLRAGVVETGICASADTFPKSSDLSGYRDVLADFAEYLIEMSVSLSTPWFVLQQALMYLISEGRPIPESRSLSHKALSHYRNLIHVTQGKLDDVQNKRRSMTPLILVALHFEGDRTRILSRLARWLQACTIDEAVYFAEAIYLAAPDVLDHLLRFVDGKSEHSAWRNRLARSYIQTCGPRTQSIASYRRKQLSLGMIIRATNNPFVHENSTLRLALAIIRSGDQHKILDRQQVSPDHLLVSCSNWGALHNPCLDHLKIDVQLAKTKHTLVDPRYAPPEWCTNATRKFMILGRLLRAAITGNYDYTAPGLFIAPMTEGYRGIRTSWFKRQYGLLNRPDAIGGPQACCSPWLTELLAKLLQWPGCREMNLSIPEWPTIHTVEDLEELLEKRLKSQASVYAKASDLPVYTFPIRTQLTTPSTLTTILIQTVRPCRKDFKHHGVTLDSAVYKPIRREHLASLFKITEKLLKLRETYDKTARADLAILPEFSVHPDDLDLVTRFIAKTNAIVLCGLAIRKIEDVKGYVNTARWVIPDQRPSGRTFVYVDQGKGHPTSPEKKYGVRPYRTHQVVIELNDSISDQQYKLAACVCYDATDLKIAADLKNVTDLLIVPSNNKDVNTFDTMTSSLSFHMYQHVAVVNSGEFGGTTLMAPYDKQYERVLTHLHGGGHASVTVVDIDLSCYQHKNPISTPVLKTPPANYLRH